VNAPGHNLVRLQDLEFPVPISAIQVTRRLTRSVGLGGNGQFSRLSALDVMADQDGPGARRSRTTSSACT
jgi:1,2-diacylglycerol 3-beta-glucosyltransferase